MLEWMDQYYSSQQVGDAIGMHEGETGFKCYKRNFIICFALGIVFMCLAVFLFQECDKNENPNNR